MNGYQLASLLAISGMAALFRFSDFWSRLLIGMMMLTAVYYGVLGPLYWGNAQFSSFLGVYWGEEIYRAGWFVCAGAFLICASALLIQFFLSRHVAAASLAAQSGELLDGTVSASGGGAFYYFCGALGFAGSFFVLILILTSQAADGNPFMLVAYQFSDIMIPFIVFRIGARGFDRMSICLLAYFGVFAAMVGFRYKLILLFFPIIFILLFSQAERERGGLKKAIVMFIMLGLVFSLLTLARQKFGGVDVEAIGRVNSEDSLYGFFAETNSLFALLGTIRESIDFERTIGLRPIRDALLELIPRFLIPDRVTGEYLAIPLQHMGTDEALTSGTAYPLVGELLLMGGITGLILGSLVWGGCFTLLMNIILATPARGMSLRIGAGGLLATFFGYYAFSRGYTPQALKGLMFVVLPVVLMIRSRAGSTQLRTVSRLV